MLEVVDASFDRVAFNDDALSGLCSRISLVPLAGGATYFLLVRAYDAAQAIASYELSINSAPANTCGNGLAEPANNERCDDGNTAGGDGCNATCDPETA